MVVEFRAEFLKPIWFEGDVMRKTLTHEHASLVQVTDSFVLFRAHKDLTFVYVPRSNVVLTLSKPLTKTTQENPRFETAQITNRDIQKKAPRK